MKDGLLSVIVVTYNSRHCVQGCLTSVRHEWPSGIEVLVVDNGSRDGTPAFIRQTFPEAVLIELEANYGPCRARNLGIARSAGEWLLVLDSDLSLQPGFAASLERALPCQSEKVGMLQANILQEGGREIYSQGILLTPWRRFYDFNRGRAASVPGPGQGEIIGPCAAAAVYRRKMLDEVKEKDGCFDERFFFLVEDVDLAWRAKKAGWQTRFIEEMLCWHTGNGSKTDSHERQWLSYRNRHWMIRKNETAAGKIWLFLISWPYEMVRMIFCFCVNPVFRRNFFKKA